MPRGGSRKGTPGTLYPNRRDLQQPVRVPVNQEYGQRQALEQSQRKQPLPQSGRTPVRQPAEDTRGVLPNLSTPSLRPNEPVTAGLPIGPGPGPEALVSGPQPSMELGVLRAIFGAYPNEDLLRLLEYTEDNL